MTVTSTAASPEAASREVSLELIGLSRRFGSVVALDGLTFSVPPGEVFGFLGPNGAGKTTTMRAIFGVVALDAGEVRWRGEPVTEEDRHRFGYMPEERGLYPSMQILEQLEYLGRLHDMTAASARDAARNWIKRLGLEGRESAKLEALSHGNQQRVQLAAALMHDPELLVLDEPFAGLDPGGVDDMTEILAERARAGVTVLFSSHQLDLVEHICEAVAIIHRGRVVAQGAVADLERGDRPRLTVRVAATRRETGPGSWIPGSPRSSGWTPAWRSSRWHRTPTRRRCSTRPARPAPSSTSASPPAACPRYSATSPARTHE